MSLVRGTLLKGKKSDWVNGVLLRKGLASLDHGEPDHTFKFRNRMVSAGLEKGGSEGQQRGFWKVQAIPREEKH